MFSHIGPDSALALSQQLSNHKGPRPGAEQPRQILYLVLGFAVLDTSVGSFLSVPCGPVLKTADTAGEILFPHDLVFVSGASQRR